MSSAIRAAVVFGVALGLALAPAHAEQVIQQASGKGHQHLQPFTVQDGWELRWEVGEDDSLLQVVIEKVNHPSPNVAIDNVTQRGPATGKKFFAKGGTYYLRIIGLAGTWAVQIVQVP